MPSSSGTIRGTWACASPCATCASGTCNSIQSTTDSFSSTGLTDLEMTSHPFAPPLGIPTGCTPVVYFVTPGTITAAGSPYISPSYVGTFGTGLPFSWNYAISYDGTIIFTDSGSAVTPARFSLCGIPLNSAPFTYNPSSLIGYSTSEQQWVLEYNGIASASTNPPIIQEFTASGVGVNGTSFDPGFMFLTPIFVESL